MDFPGAILEARPPLSLPPPTADLCLAAAVRLILRLVLRGARRDVARVDEVGPEPLDDARLEAERGGGVRDGRVRPAARSRRGAACGVGEHTALAPSRPLRGNGRPDFNCAPQALSSVSPRGRTARDSPPSFSRRELLGSTSRRETAGRRRSPSGCTCDAGRSGCTAAGASPLLTGSAGDSTCAAAARRRVACCGICRAPHSGHTSRHAELGFDSEQGVEPEVNATQAIPLGHSCALLQG
jgi:hypothetical protein